MARGNKWVRSRPLCKFVFDADQQKDLREFFKKFATAEHSYAEILSDYTAFLNDDLAFDNDDDDDDEV